MVINHMRCLSNMVLVFAALFLAHHLAFSAIAYGEDEPDIPRILNDVNLKWNEQKGEVASGRYNLRIYRYTNTENKPFRRVQLVQLLDRVGAAPSRAILIEMLDGQPTGQWEAKRKGGKLTLWDKALEVVFDGPKLKNAAEGSAAALDVTYDGLNEIRYSATNKQVDIKHKSNIEVFDRNIIRFIPWVDYSKNPNMFRSCKIVSGRIRLEGPKVEIEFDRDTGLISDFVLKNQLGYVNYERRQYGIIDVIGVSSPYPKLFAIVDYGDDETVQMLTVFLVESLDINEPIPVSEFNVIVPGHTNIFDYRGRPNPRYASFDEPVDPVKAMDQSAGAEGVRRDDVGRKNRIITLILVNIIFLAIIIAFYWKRSRRPRS